MARIFIKNLGCKVNTFDGQALENQFLAQGHEIVTSPELGDITVVNTCSVTQAADREARHLIRRFHRSKPDSMVVVTGCYAQTDSAKLVSMPEVSYVVPNEAKDRLVDLVATHRRNTGSDEGSESNALDKFPSDLETVRDNRQSHFKAAVTFFDQPQSSRARSFLKIQDGCNGFCAYCLIPYARGASRSVPRNTILEEVTRLASQPIGEIVLTGIHIGDYGRDLPDYSGQRDPFASLLREIVQIDNIPRLRISSLEPNEVSDELLQVISENPKKFCAHFHLPLQSGSDRILKLMRRTYSTAEYAAAVQKIRSTLANSNIGADIVPGFPGETEDDFQSTMDFIKEVNLGYLHVFPYSSRPNTAASRMLGHLPGQTIKGRAAELRNLSRDLQNTFSMNQIGLSAAVVWENEFDAQGRQKGHASNYQVCRSGRQVKFPVGSLSTHRIKGLIGEGEVLVAVSESDSAQANTQ